jgi:excisionase family DNA binding protein
MAAYASQHRESLTRGYPSQAGQLRLASFASIAEVEHATATVDRAQALDGIRGGSAVFDQLVDCIAERLAAAVAKRLGTDDTEDAEWFDSRHAAEYLGVHRDTLRKLAAERAIPSEQDGPGCKLYFRRSELDAWRRSGGRPRHLASRLSSVA